MFKNSTKFAQALLDGREFKDKINNRFHLDPTKENPFRFNDDIMRGAWGGFNQVTEILPEPELWTPKEGDLIEVWDTEQDCSAIATFVCLCEDLFIVKSDRDEFEVWFHAAPIKPTNPWIEHAPNTWPVVKPNQKIEVQAFNNNTTTGEAGEFEWVPGIIEKYRPIDS